METAHEYTIGWICALEIEYSAACDVLDERYDLQGPADGNSYTFGQIHEHKIVIVCLPKGRYGITSAAIIVERLKSSFPSIKFGLLVGIAGGAPSATQDIRLGDVVVSSPGIRHGGVIQYDFGKTIQNLEFEQTGHLAPPPEILLNTITHLSTQHKRNGHRIQDTVAEMVKKNSEYRCPNTDKLCVSSYVHCEDCECLTSSTNGPHLVDRQSRDTSTGPLVHHGLIASAHSLLKDANIRDALVQKYQVLCFEMEAAGVMNSLPCLVVRGICDYSDTHKNKNWQGYAAATAAAYAKELLEVIPSKKIQQDSIYAVPLSFKGIPVTKKFVGQSEQISALSKALLPRNRRQLFVLSGLGGIGKTQLAVEFCRLHSSDFTAICWLDGSSKDALNQSIASYASRIPASTIWNPDIAKNLDSNIDAVVQAVIHWFEQADNKKWLIVFDNVDREHLVSDHLSYDIRRFIPQADHGSVLITTRLIQLGQLGGLLEVKKVDTTTAKEILDSWYTKSYDVEDGARLFEHLDGLPLAIAQAGAFLQESGVDMKTYIRLYEDRRKEVAQSLQESVLQDYPNRNIWTTWSISYEAIYNKDKHAAHLLVFWSFLARNDLWFGLFKESLEYDILAERLKLWLGSIPSQEISFIKAMGLLRSYCLVEGGQASDGYSMHTVLHRWTYIKEGLHHAVDIGVLSLEVIGLAVPDLNDREVDRLQHRIFPHAEICLAGLFSNGSERVIQDPLIDHTLTEEIGISAVCMLGFLFSNQGRFKEGEKLFKMALNGSERLCKPNDHWPLNIVNSIVSTYQLQNRCDEAEKLLLNYSHSNVNALATGKHSIRFKLILSKVYINQGKFEEAEQIIWTLLHATEEMYGANHQITLNVVNNLAVTLGAQHKFAEADSMYKRVLKSKEAVLGLSDIATLETVCDIGRLRVGQQEYGEAEHLFLRAYQGYEYALGPDHSITLGILLDLGITYNKQLRFVEAERAFLDTLKGAKLLRPTVVHDLLVLSCTRYLERMYVLNLGKVEEGKVFLRRALNGDNIIEGESSE